MEMGEMGRVCLRRQDGKWVAYYAPLDTMDGALEIATIRIGLTEQHPEVKKAFLELTILAMTCALKAIGGPEATVEFTDPEPVPPIERMQ